MKCSPPVVGSIALQTVALGGPSVTKKVCPYAREVAELLLSHQYPRVPPLPRVAKPEVFVRGFEAASEIRSRPISYGWVGEAKSCKAAGKFLVIVYRR